jgi:hypothetical protein
VLVQSNIITPVAFALNAATEETPIAANTTVATFSDANIADTAGNLTATIDWGDGTTTSGTVVGSLGLFAVDGGHTYRVEGNFQATATLTRTADNMKGVASGTIAVAEGPTIPEDFAGNGFSGVLWRQTNPETFTQNFMQWSMNGANLTASQTDTFQGDTILPDASWNVLGTGDFNGDGHQDILWRNSNGSLQEWLMNGATITASQAPTFQGSAVSPDSSWSVIAAGDFNGDNKSDALWRQSTTGALSEWLMNGSQITAVSTGTSQSVNPMPDASWQVQSKPTNFV